MPRQTENVVMSLETLYWAPDPLRDQDLSVQPCVWPVFFKIDGATAVLSDQPETFKKLVGTATVVGTTGTGRLAGRLAVNATLAIPPEVGQWSGQVQPIPVGPDLQTMLGTDVAGIFGVLAVVLDPSGLPANAIEAGHAALNEAVQTALDQLITELPPLPVTIPPGDIDEAGKSIAAAVESAITSALSSLQAIKEYLFDTTASGYIQTNFKQDDLQPQDVPPGDVNQVEFTNTFTWAYPGTIGVNGAFARARRGVSQGILSHFDSGVRAVAGYADPSYQHAIVGTGDGKVTEIWWQGAAGTGQGTLSQFTSGIVGLAAFYADDGYHHVIVGTDDGNVTELWWQGGGAVGRGVLAHMNSPIRAMAGYFAEDTNNAIVATADGTVTQIWWQGSAPPGQGAIAHFPVPVVALTGYAAPDGYEHVFVANAYGLVTELYWQGPNAAVQGAQMQLDAYPWNSVVGLGGYYAAEDGLQHVIAATTDGTLREFFWSVGNPILRDDLTNVSVIVPAIGAYEDPSGYQHVIVGTKEGNVHEVYWKPRAHRHIGPRPGNRKGFAGLNRDGAPML
jgi:hypothetical protein